MQHRFRTSALVTVLALVGVALAGATSPARAVVYDVPSVTILDIGKSVAVARVQAGANGATGGFRVQWMEKSLFDANGGWPAVEDYNQGLVFCAFDGAPTLNTTYGTTTFQLGPNAVAYIEVGDIFDETGMYANYDGEMTPGTEYILRVRAESYGPIQASPWGPNQVFSTDSQESTDCTYTIGFWKNHEEVWPTNSLILGGVLYTKAQLLAILAQPAQGNGLVFLAHQMIAAELNVLNGATLPLTQSTALANAHTLINGLVIPPVGAGYIHPSQASGLTQTLDQYNNGITGPGHCGTVPVESTTWSAIKSLLK
jgi:hypothetical protein